MHNVERSVIATVLEIKWFVILQVEQDHLLQRHSILLEILYILNVDIVQR